MFGVKLHALLKLLLWGRRNTAPTVSQGHATQGNESGGTAHLKAAEIKTWRIVERTSPDSTAQAKKACHADLAVHNLPNVLRLLLKMRVSALYALNGGHDHSAPLIFSRCNQSKNPWLRHGKHCQGPVFILTGRHSPDSLIFSEAPACCSHRPACQTVSTELFLLELLLLEILELTHTDTPIFARNERALATRTMTKNLDKIVS